MEFHVSLIMLLKFPNKFFLLLFIFKKEKSDKISHMINWARAIDRQSENFRVHNLVSCLTQASVDNSRNGWHKDWCAMFASLDGLGRQLGKPYISQCLTSVSPRLRARVKTVSNQDVVPRKKVWNLRNLPVNAKAVYFFSPQTTTATSLINSCQSWNLFHIGDRQAYFLIFVELLSIIES